jgi:hypothetical protein
MPGLCFFNLLQACLPCIIAALLLYQKRTRQFLLISPNSLAVSTFNNWHIFTVRAYHLFAHDQELF